MFLGKIARYFNIFLMTILVLEYICFNCTVDLIPFTACSIVCGICILSHNKQEEYQDGYTTVTVQRGEEIGIVSYLILSVIVLLIGFVFVIRGLPVLWETLIYMLNNFKVFRYIIYGLLYPVIFSTFITYCYTETNPMEQLHVDVFFILLFVTLFIGIGICMNWESYFLFAQTVVNIF